VLLLLKAAPDNELADTFGSCAQLTESRQLIASAALAFVSSIGRIGMILNRSRDVRGAVVLVAARRLEGHSLSQQQAHRKGGCLNAASAINVKMRSFERYATSDDLTRGAG